MSDVALWVVALVLFVITTLRWLLLPVSVSWAAWVGFSIGAAVGGYLSSGSPPVLLCAGFALAALAHYANSYRLAARYGMLSQQATSKGAVLQRQSSSRLEVEGDLDGAPYPKVPESFSDRSRTVLVIVTEWPSGTMAMKFGRAIENALKLNGREMQLLQMEPERIFRAQTAVSEAEFREAVSKADVSYKGEVRFVEL